MIFGKIEYLNLLPFHIFMKRYLKGSSHKQILHYKKGVPSEINSKFKNRKIDAAFISSINSSKCKCLDLGIISKKEVQSVLVLRGRHQNDSESATSNALAKVLHVEGKVLIGDKALKYFLNTQEDVTDLAKLWYEKYSLPFVFARLCYHGKDTKYKKLSKTFLKTKHKIPQYILEASSKKTGIKKSDILSYLKLIEYDLSSYSKLSLKRFLALANK